MLECLEQECFKPPTRIHVKSFCCNTLELRNRILKTLKLKIILSCAAVVLMTAAASGQVVGTFGDFTVFGSAIDTGVQFFDSGTNPSPFPNPVPLQAAATWPAPSNTLTVAQLQTFLANQGLPNNTFLVLIKMGGGATTLTSLSVIIGGTTVAEGIGTFALTANNNFAFDGNFSLSSSSASVQVAYSVLDGTVSNINEINLAATPEPMSIAFLATGFLGLVASRLKRRRR